MSVGTYSAYTGVAARLAHLDAIANNIANASTTGYRRDRTRFDMVLAARMPFVRPSTGGIDPRPGTLQLTREPLHAALQGPGFFVVQDPSGRALFTRRGDFRLDGEGRLVLPNGMPVLGSGGEIAIPPGSRPRLLGDGTVLTESGEIGRLRVVRFDDPALLQKRGTSLLSAGATAEPETLSDPRIAVGFLEASNVNLAAEMVALIETARSFEAAMQSIRLNDQITQRLIEAQR
jgi:flagellar basal body rod protein FlgG